MSVQVERDQPARASELSPPAARPAEPAAFSRATYAGVGIVLAIQAAVIGWYAAHSWFFVDDFLFLRQAKDSSLTVSYLRLSLFEHFSPVHRLADWLLMQWGTPSWTVAATVLVLVTLGCSLAFAYLVSGITRDGRIVVVMTALYSLSLFFIRTSVWWTAGIHLMSVTLFSMLALGGYIRWHQRRSMGSLVLSVIALALALLTHEDALLLIGVLVMLRLLVLTPHPRSVRDVYRAFRDDVWVWAIYVALSGLAVWNFVTYYWSQQPRPTVGQFARYLWMATGEGFFSTVFLVKVPEAQLHSATFTGVLALAAGLVVIGFTILTRVGAWRSWVFFLIAFVATAVPLGLSRVVMFGATIGRDPIYQMGPAALFLFALAVAIGAPRREGSERFAVRLPTRRTTRTVLVCTAAVLFLGLYLRGANLLDGTWQTTPTRDYFTNLRADESALSARGIHPQLFNPVVPSSIVPPFLIPYDRLAINLMVPSIPSTSADPSYIVTPDGHLEHVRVDTRSSGAIPSDAATMAGWSSVGSDGCAAPRPGAPAVEIALPTPVTGEHLAIHVTGTFPRGAAVTLAADGVNLDVAVTKGSAIAYVPGPSISRVAVAMPPGSGCIARVDVEQLVPIGSP